MVIGFTQLHQTVSECDIPGEDLCMIEIGVSTERISERELVLGFFILSFSTAIVEPLAFNNLTEFDATFGIRDEPGDPIEDTFVLEPLSDFIPPRRAFIRNDSKPEGNESFTIRIIPVDIPGIHTPFICNEDDEGATNYFCRHTVTIIDDDGKNYVHIYYFLRKLRAKILECNSLGII